MIVSIKESDLLKIHELEEKFPTIFLHSDIVNDLKNNPYSKYIVYTIEDRIVGFINYYDIYERMEIVNFNVLDFFQNHHIGSNLLEYLIELAIKNNKKNITLEVRKDNEKAIYLYEKYGFKKVSIRKKYYNDVDGILMEKEMM